MIVMPGNDRGAWWGYLAGKYSGKIGSLVSPGRWKSPVPFAPYALDNGAYIRFDERAFLNLIEKAKRAAWKPLWIVVPDVVGNKSETLKLWKEWEPRLKPLKWPLAMAMQDGMTPDDFKGDVAFIGGSTSWKWKNLRMWDGIRTHVGRVNTERHLWAALESGAESCDGTGWFRNESKTIQPLLKFLDEVENGRNVHPELNLDYDRIT